MLPQQITTDVLLEKYAKGEEKTDDDVFRRVCIGVAKGEANVHKERMVPNENGVQVPKMIHEHDYWAEVFYQNMKRGALGAGRIMSAAGTDVDATLINCFTIPVGDSITGKDDDGYIGIYDALTESAETLRRGGGVGYDFSLIRPKNAKVGKVGAFASGPCSYMNIFNSSCETIESAGARRGAQMGSMRIDHPDIEEFIKAKRTDKRWSNFNVSVFVSDMFMKAKNTDEEIDLVHKAEPTKKLIETGAYQREDGMWVYKKIKARELWDLIMKSNYDYAEPGILFADNINNDNNLRYCENIRTTNPCAEQPLPDYGCCDLGPIDLTKFVVNAFKSNAEFLFDSFKEAIRLHVRFLDNVLDVTLWPLEKQQKEAQSKRRIGIGFTGLGNMLAMMNYKYNEQDGAAAAAYVAETMRDTAYRASVELAKERGAFPLFDADKYLEEGTFASRLPVDIKDSIREFGIRNSHLLSIAPVGTVSLAFCDNASNGIEPPFSLTYFRQKRNSDGTKTSYSVVDHSLRVFLNTLTDKLFADAVLEALLQYRDTFIYKELDYKIKDILPPSIITAMEMSPTEHLRIMKAVQPYIDSSMSKTVNIPADYPFDNFKTVYDLAWQYKLKGVATYRPNNIIGSVLSVGEVTSEKKELEKKRRDDNEPNSILIPKRPEGCLPAVMDKIKYYSDGIDHSFFIGVSFMLVNGVRNNTKVTVRRPIEIFIITSPDSVPLEWATVYARTMSLIARTNLALFVKALQDNRSISSGKQIRYGWFFKDDSTKVPRHHGSDVAVLSYAIQQILIKERVLDGEGTIDNVYSSDFVEQQETVQVPPVQTKPEVKPITGKACPDCGAHTLIKADGCERCTSCGYMGSCG